MIKIIRESKGTARPVVVEGTVFEETDVKYRIRVYLLGIKIKDVTDIKDIKVSDGDVKSDKSIGFGG